MAAQREWSRSPSSAYPHSLGSVEALSPGSLSCPVNAVLLGAPQRCRVPDVVFGCPQDPQSHGWHCDVQGSSHSTVRSHPALLRTSAEINIWQPTSANSRNKVRKTAFYLSIQGAGGINKPNQWCCNVTELVCVAFLLHLHASCVQSLHQQPDPMASG